MLKLKSVFQELYVGFSVYCVLLTVFPYVLDGGWQAPILNFHYFYHSRALTLFWEGLHPAAEASYEPALHGWLMCQDQALGVRCDYLLWWVNVIIIAGFEEPIYCI